MLQISKNVDLDDIVNGGNPITTEHPITGSAVTIQLWLFNDDDTKRYTNVSIDPTDLTDTDESNWVQVAPDNAGSAGTFGSAGASMSMEDVETADVGIPFWIKVTSAVVAESQNKTDISLRVPYREYAV